MGSFTGKNDLRKRPEESRGASVLGGGRRAGPGISRNSEKEPKIKTAAAT